MSARSALHSNGADSVAQDDEEEEVDAFGRIVPKESRRRSRSRSRSRSNSPDRDDSDFRRRRYADSDDSRRRRSRSPDRRDRNGGQDRDRGDRRGGDRRDVVRRDDRRPPPSAPILNITPRSFHRPTPPHQQPFPPPPPAAYPPYPSYSHPPIHLSLPSAAHSQHQAHAVPLLSLHEWMAVNGVDALSVEAERRYGDYRSEAALAPRRAYFDAHKHEEWMAHQYGCSAFSAKLAQRQQEKQLQRQHWLDDVLHGADSAHLHLLDDVPSAPASAPAIVDNTLVIPPFPHRVNRSALLGLVSSLPGFRLLSVASSTAKNHGSRIAFLVLSSHAACSAAIEQCKGQRVDGWEVRVRGSVREVARRDVPALVREERTVREHVRRAQALIDRLDEECGLPPFQAAQLHAEGADGDMRRLNLCLSYMRWVHAYCFYCACEYRDVEALVNACGMTHRRRAADSGGGASDLDRDAVERIERRVEERARGEGGWAEEDRRKLERVREALLRRHVEQKAEGKWRCTLCTKLFKGEEFVLKHLVNKHEAETQQVEARLGEEYMWREYATDAQAVVEDKADKQSTTGGSSGMPLLFRPGSQLNAITTMPYVPGLHDTAMADAQPMLSLLSPGVGVVSLPTISIAPPSLAPQQLPPPTAPPAVSGRRGLTSYADLDVPDVAPQLPTHGLLLTPADKAAVHYGSKGKWVPKGKKGTAAGENGKAADGHAEEKEAQAEAITAAS